MNRYDKKPNTKLKLTEAISNQIICLQSRFLQKHLVHRGSMYFLRVYRKVWRKKVSTGSGVLLKVQNRKSLTKLRELSIFFRAGEHNFYPESSFPPHHQFSFLPDGDCVAKIRTGGPQVYNYVKNIFMVNIEGYRIKTSNNMQPPNNQQKSKY